MTRLACGQPDWNHSAALCTAGCIDPEEEHVAYPVDSATRSCCGGIGQHTNDCTHRW